MKSDTETNSVNQIDGEINRRLGPHKVPRIECKCCGTEHHYDAAHGSEIGHCRNCSAFLRRPTEAEHEKFTDFLVWNSQHLDANTQQSE